MLAQATGAMSIDGGDDGVATAEEVLDDRVLHAWTDGLTGSQLGLEPQGAEVEPTGCAAQDRYRDPRKRVDVEHLSMSVGDAYAVSRILGVVSPRDAQTPLALLPWQRTPSRAVG